MNNMQMVDFIFNYEGTTDVNKIVAKDVKKRINDWMMSEFSTLEDEYIDKQIEFFQKFIKIE